MQDLHPAWTQPRTKARLHILRAHGTSKAVIIRRKPSKCAHILLWNTATDSFEYGSWFKGRIYTERCDISWDGRWMVYLAMGAGGDTWNGICEVPWLRTIATVPNMGTWGGGGFFSGSNTLQVNDCSLREQSLMKFSTSEAIPFGIERVNRDSELNSLLFHRLNRDGWKRVGEIGKYQEISLKNRSRATLCVDDPGWSWQPSSEHPVLRMYYRGYLVRGETFEFQLQDSDILDPEVDWATWDAKGDLIVAREGMVLRYTLEGLKNGVPAFSIDLEHLRPPQKVPNEPG